jgi:hypothetical protein
VWSSDVVDFCDTSVVVAFARKCGKTLKKLVHLSDEFADAHDVEGQVARQQHWKALYDLFDVVRQYAFRGPHPFPWAARVFHAPLGYATGLFSALPSTCPST